MSVFVRDELRAYVEGATGGQCTVRYTAQGMPSYFFVLPKFNLEDIDASLGFGTHPAFIVNGVEVPRLFIGMFEGAVRNSELLSLAQLMPTTGMTIGNAAQYARNCGAGYHLLTNAEWAAIALWCFKNQWLPSGNSDNGRAFAAPYETGVRGDGLDPGDVTGIGITRAGSGPLSWRHNNRSTGIADLVGNVREWVAGVRLVNGELQIFPNNDAAAYQGDFSTASNWQAVRFSNGTLLAAGAAGATKMDSVSGVSGAPGQNVGPFVWSDAITHQLGPLNSNAELDYNGVAFSEIATGPALLKTLALAPISAGDLMGSVFARNYGTRYFSRGGRYLSHGEAGIFGMAAMDIVTDTHYFTGARVAKY